MSDLKPILRAIDFFEVHLRKPVSVADAAEAVGYSLFYFTRRFNQFAHQSPYEYLMRRRLSQAARDLVERDNKVLDIALDYQFSSAEGFSRAIRRMFGLLPTQIRKQGWISERHLMPRFTWAYLAYLQDADLHPVRESLDALELAGLMTFCELNQPVVPELWRVVHKELVGSLQSSQPCALFGVIQSSLDEVAQRSLYFAGVPAACLTRASDVFLCKTLPGQDYARFQFEGTVSDLHNLMSYIDHTWLPHSGYLPSDPLLIEHFSSDQITKLLSGDIGKADLLVKI